VTEFIDTSAIYAVLDRDDAEHSKAAARWKNLVEGEVPVVTTNYVVVEACALVQHRLGLAAVRTLAGSILPAIGLEWVIEDDHGKALSALLLAGRRKLSFVDCVSFQVMRRLEITRAFAFDTHFRDAGFDLG
jgi:predicted nucleic acid-binding protein